MLNNTATVSPSLWVVTNEKNFSFGSCLSWQVHLLENCPKWPQASAYPYASKWPFHGPTDTQ